MAGLVLARVVDPVTAQQIVGIITGMGEENGISPDIISIHSSLLSRNTRIMQAGYFLSVMLIGTLEVIGCVQPNSSMGEQPSVTVAATVSIPHLIISPEPSPRVPGG